MRRQVRQGESAGSAIRRCTPSLSLEAARVKGRVCASGHPTRWRQFGTDADHPGPRDPMIERVSAKPTAAPGAGARARSISSMTPRTLAVSAAVGDRP